MLNLAAGMDKVMMRWKNRTYQEVRTERQGDGTNDETLDGFRDGALPDDELCTGSTGCVYSRRVYAVRSTKWRH